MLKKLLLLVLALAFALSTTADAGPVAGRDLAVRSSGATRGDAWRLSTNGYAGAYLRLDAAETVSLTVRARGTAARDTAPRMMLSVGDAHRLFEVGPKPMDYQASFGLPPGTHFVRIALVNHGPDTPVSLAIGALSVAGAERGGGVELVNQHTDALALAAADTYIEHGRRGVVRLNLPGTEPGTPVRARLTRLGFHLGANIPGTSNAYLHPDAPPSSEPALFQKHFLESFNTTVPSNAGKWAYNEPEPGVVTMGYVDTILGFAETHGLRARMHALIWDTEQQPPWVRELIADALGGDTAAKAELRAAITRRIGYYARDRARRFDAIDVLNESYHQPGYLDIFGPEGIAGIYRETAEAIDAGGGDAQTFINEYNVLQWSRWPPYATRDTAPDPYANWYREHAEDLIRRGARLGAIGVQYYADARETIGDNAHSPARIAGVLHNLALTGLPISLTEFGVGRGATPRQAADILDHTLRLMFGHPRGQTFLMFGFYRGATWDRAAEATLFDEDWSRSEPGHAYARLMDRWSTDVTLPVDAEGGITFTGYHGEYAITVGDRAVPLTVTKGRGDYTIQR